MGERERIRAQQGANVFVMIVLVLYAITSFVIASWHSFVALAVLVGILNVIIIEFMINISSHLETDPYGAMTFAILTMLSFTASSRVITIVWVG